MMVEISRREVLGAGSMVAMAAGSLASAQEQTLEQPVRPMAGALARDLAPREELLLDFGWRFALGHACDVAKDFNFGAEQRLMAKQGQKNADVAKADFNDQSWTQVQLPHDWAIDLPFVPSTGKVPEWDPRADHGYKPLGREFPETSVGWYRRSVDIPASDKGRRLTLRFDGVFRDAIVFVNGFIVARNESGYAPFSVEISDFLSYGKANVIAVRVDASHGEGWFYEGAGIYRHVWLDKTDPLHLVEDGLHVIATPKGKDARIDCNVAIAQSLEIREGQSVYVVASVLDAQRRPVLAGRRAGRLRPDGTLDLSLSLNLKGAQRWSVDSPYLYTMRVELFAGARRLDVRESAFGVRSVRFDAEKGFFLNDQPLKLLGACCHHDHAGVGAGVPDAVQTFRIAKLKEMGVNAYRSSHNPAPPAVLEACDRLGMLVIDETRMASSSPEGLSQLQRMVRRGRNHPCIIAWSILNEEGALQANVLGEQIGATMVRHVRALDPTRVTTAALDNGWGEGVSKVVDVLGFNYRTDKMEAYHQKVPSQPLIGSETASTVCTRGEYIRDDARQIVPAYDREHPWWATTSEFWWKIVAERPYIAGGFIWTGFDYRGEPTPFTQYPAISSYFGVMDTCGFPKDNYYYYKAWWKPAEPLLHLLPHWNWEGQEGKPIEVWAHSNLDAVELLVNGVSVGRQDVPRNGHVEWKVPYQPGAIEARGFRNGALALTTRRETAGPAASVHLSADRLKLHANGEDCAMLSAEIRDAQGRPVPKADHLVRFTVNGVGARIIGVGNGNPTSLEPDRASQRKAFNSLCAAILQTGFDPGDIEVIAQADGLTSGRLLLTANPTARRAFV